MAKKYSFRERLTKNAAGDSSDVLRYPVNTRIPAGERHHITRLAFEDATTACTEVQVNVNRGGVSFPQEEQLAPVAGYLYWVSDEIVLNEGEQLELYFSGATASDILKAFVNGYWVEVGADA